MDERRDECRQDGASWAGISRVKEYCDSCFVLVRHVQRKDDCCMIFASVSVTVGL